MRRWATTLFRIVTRIEEACLAGGILGIALLTSGNAVLRATMGESILFAEEVSRFLIVLVTFVGIGYAASQGRHIRMTALTDAMGRRARKGVMLLVTGFTALLMFAFTWLALDYVLGTVRELGTVSPVLQVPRFVVYLAAPLGFFLAGVQYMLAFLKNLTTRDVYIGFEHRDEYDDDASSGVP